MKITNKKYAQALFESIQNKNEEEINIILKNFIELLIKKNALSKIDKIINEFNNIWNKKNKIIKATITTAKNFDESTFGSLKKYIKDLSGAEKLKIDRKIDENLISGTIIKYGDRILDNSLKTKINNLRIKMTSNY